MDWLTYEEEWLAPYAMHSSQSRGRQYPEEPHPFRTVYQRDRERIVHCTAFRRMTATRADPRALANAGPLLTSVTSPQPMIPQRITPICKR